MSSTYNKINEVFNTSFDKQVQETTPEPKKQTVVTVKNEYQLTVTQSKEDIQNNFTEDYDFIRETLRDLIITGKDSLVVARDLAEATESPRAFEVCTSIITTIAGLGKELTNLHKEALKIAEPTKQKDDVEVVPANVTNIQNNIYTDPNAVYQVLDNIKTVEFDDSELE